MRLVYTSFLLLTLLVVQNASAKIIEEQIKTEVKVKNVYGREIEREVISHVIRNANAKSPILIYNHGRGPGTLSATAPNFVNRCAHSKFFIDYGFAVVSPMRIGYGVTGGPDLEHPDQQRVGFEATEIGANQIIQVVEHLKTLDWADTSKVVILGGSMGGSVAMNLATRTSPQIEFVLNFAAGFSGNPDHAPGQPTRPDLTEQIFRRFGKENKVPTFWFYSVNDRYWGEKYPKQWFAAFQSAGGRGEFFSLPPYGRDGHSILCGEIEAWRDDMTKIFDNFGYKKVIAVPSLIDDVSKVPFLRDTGRDAYKVFLGKGFPRAFAINEFGFFGWASGTNAKERALENCNKRMPNTCRLYAVDYEVIWNNQ